MNKSVYLGVCATLTLSACVSLKQPYPEKHFHLIELERSENAAVVPAGASTATGEVLLVRRFAISPGFEGRGLVYRRASGTFEVDFYNEFFVSPAALLSQLTRDWLADSPMLDTVVDAGSQLEPTLVLEGSIATLYGDYSIDGSPAAVLALELMLLRRSAAGAEIAFQADYEIREPAEGNGPEALIDAWQRGLERALTQFEHDLQMRL